MNRVIINKDGTVSVVADLVFDIDTKKELIKRLVSDGGKYTGDELHKRWTALYNAYDLAFGGCIRDDHAKCITERGGKFFSRVDYVALTGKMDNLFYVAGKLYNHEFERFIGYYLSF